MAQQIVPAVSANLLYGAGTGTVAYDEDGAGAGAAVNLAILGQAVYPGSLGADFLIVA